MKKAPPKHIRHSPTGSAGPCLVSNIDSPVKPANDNMTEVSRPPQRKKRRPVGQRFFIHSPIG